jgi:tetratricopeptide (TPR) repeat protein
MNFKALIPLVFLFLTFACQDNNSKEGDKLYQQGQYEQAVKAYTDFIKYNPTDVRSIYNRGRSYEELGQHAEALKDYEAVLKLDEKNTNVMISIGRHFFRENKFEDAAFYFDKATQENNNLKVAQFLKGRSYHKAGITDKAMEAYNAAINVDGNYGEAYLYRGALRIYLKRKAAGCSDLKTAQSLKVKEAEAALQQYCN